MAATAKTANGCGICISLSDEINKIYRALCAISPKIKEEKEKHVWSKQTLNKKEATVQVCCRALNGMTTA
jgi:hypothetical protein